MLSDHRELSDGVDGNITRSSPGTRLKWGAGEICRYGASKPVVLGPGDDLLLKGLRQVIEITCLLCTTSAGISEIAQRCGFCDQSVFSRDFKAAAGLTPSQYRERHAET